MSNRKEKSFVPLILILIGGTLILGAILVILLSPEAPQGEIAQSSSRPVSTSEIARVKPDEAKVAFDSGGAIFVDVRPEGSFFEGHIPGALSIPLAELPSRLDELDQKGWIILY